MHENEIPNIFKNYKIIKNYDIYKIYIYKVIIYY